MTKSRRGIEHKKHASFPGMQKIDMAKKQEPKPLIIDLKKVFDK